MQVRFLDNSGPEDVLIFAAFSVLFFYENAIIRMVRGYGFRLIHHHEALCHTNIGQVAPVFKGLLKIWNKLEKS